MFRLRLLRFIIFWFLKPKLGLLAEHRLSLRAWPIIDIDVTRMMAHAFTRAMVLGRYQLVFGSEFRGFAFRKRWYPATVAEMLQIYRPIRVFEKFAVTSQILCWNEKKFYAEQRLVVGDGEVRARALIEGVIGGPAGFMRPGEVFAQMGVTRESPGMTEEIAAWIKNRPTFAGSRRPRTQGL